MDKKTVIICLVVGLLIGIAVPVLVNSYERPEKNNIMEVAKLTKLEYRKIIWGFLKEYRDDKAVTLEKLLELIMAVPFPKEGNPYVGMSTREDLTFNKKDKSRRY